MKYQLIQLTPLQRLSKFPDDAMGFPAVLTIPDDREPPTLPDGFRYVPIEDQPTYDSATQTISRTLSPERDGWVVIAIPDEVLQKRATIESAKAAAQAAFDAMPRGKRVLWEATRAAVAEAVEEGDFAGAREILESTPATYPEAEAERQQFLRLFPEP